MNFYGCLFGNIGLPEETLGLLIAAKRITANHKDSSAPILLKFSSIVSAYHSYPPHFLEISSFLKIKLSLVLIYMQDQQRVSTSLILQTPNTTLMQCATSNVSDCCTYTATRQLFTLIRSFRLVSIPRTSPP